MALLVSLSPSAELFSPCFVSHRPIESIESVTGARLQRFTPRAKLNKVLMGTSPLLDDGLELSLFVLGVGLAGDHRAHGGDQSPTLSLEGLGQGAFGTMAANHVCRRAGVDPPCAGDVLGGVAGVPMASDVSHRLSKGAVEELRV